MSDEDPGPSQKRYRFGDDRPQKNAKITEDEIAKIREMSTLGTATLCLGRWCSTWNPCRVPNCSLKFPNRPPVHGGLLCKVSPDPNLCYTQENLGVPQRNGARANM